MCAWLRRKEPYSTRGALQCSPVLDHRPCEIVAVAQGTLGPVGAKTGEVLAARLLARVPVSAALSVLAEAARVPRAVARFLVGAYVEEDALLVAALAEIGKIPALRHAIVVQPVQELALVALLAQASQPVLANHLVAPRIKPHIRWGERRLLDAEHLRKQTNSMRRRSARGSRVSCSAAARRAPRRCQRSRVPAPPSPLARARATRRDATLDRTARFSHFPESHFPQPPSAPMVMCHVPSSVNHAATA